MPNDNTIMSLRLRFSHPDAAGLEETATDPFEGTPDELCEMLQFLLGGCIPHERLERLRAWTPGGEDLGEVDLFGDDMTSGLKIWAADLQLGDRRRGFLPAGAMPGQIAKALASVEPRPHLVAETVAEVLVEGMGLVTHPADAETAEPTEDLSVSLVVRVPGRVRFQTPPLTVSREAVADAFAAILST